MNILLKPSKNCWLRDKFNLPHTFPIPLLYLSHALLILSSYCLHTLFIHSSYTLHTELIQNSYSSLCHADAWDNGHKGDRSRCEIATMGGDNLCKRGVLRPYSQNVSNNIFTVSQLNAILSIFSVISAKQFKRLKATKSSSPEYFQFGLNILFSFQFK